MNQNALRYLWPIATVCLLVAMFFAGVKLRLQSTIDSPLIGKSVPHLCFKQGTQDVCTDDFLGAPFVINVWATWCTTCIQEHDYLLVLSEALKAKNIPMLSLVISDEAINVTNFLNARGNPYRYFALDNTGDMAFELGAYGTPELFLVNAEGIVVQKHLGEMNERVWQKRFSPYLN